MSRVLLVELIAVDRFHRSIEFPFVQGYYRSHGLETRSVRIGLPAVWRSREEGWPAEDVSRLVDLAAAAPPTHVLFNLAPDERLLDALRGSPTRPTLGRLDDRDLRVEHRKWRAKRDQLRVEYFEALATHDRTRVNIANAKVAQAGHDRLDAGKGEPAEISWRQNARGAVEQLDGIDAGIADLDEVADQTERLRRDHGTHAKGQQAVASALDGEVPQSVDRGPVDAGVGIGEDRRGQSGLFEQSLHVVPLGGEMVGEGRVEPKRSERSL